MTGRWGGGLVLGLGIVVAVIVAGRERIRRYDACEGQQIREGCVMALLATGQIADDIPGRICLRVVSCRELLWRRWARSPHLPSDVT